MNTRLWGETLLESFRFVPSIACFVAYCSAVVTMCHRSQTVSEVQVEECWWHHHFGVFLFSYGLRSVVSKKHTDIGGDVTKGYKIINEKKSNNKVTRQSPPIDGAVQNATSVNPHRLWYIILAITCSENVRA